MDDYPRSLAEFRARFATDEACLAYLVACRWPGGFVCPACGGTGGWLMARGLFLCQACRRQVSVTSGTIFHQTRLPLRQWFEAMWHLTQQKYGANALGLQRLLGLGSYHTAWRWLHRLRRAMVRPDRDRLSGQVEVDETYLGGERSGKRGRGAANKALIVVAVEDTAKPGGKQRGMGRVRLARIPNASAATLEAFLRENVAPGSRVRTDGWLGYAPLAESDYVHEVVGSHEMVITHRVVSLLKRWLMGTYQGAVQVQHLDYYLDEYTFRFNRRKAGHRGLLFYRLVQQAVATAPIRGECLRGDHAGEHQPTTASSQPQDLGGG